MAIGLVQSQLGGSISTSGNLNGSGQFPMSCSGSFNNQTVAGNTIVVIIWVTAITDVTSGAAGSVGGGTTTGISGSPNTTRSANTGYFSGGGSKIEGVFVKVTNNASSIGPLNTITANATLNAGNLSLEAVPFAKMEFALLEFSGVANTGEDAGQSGNFNNTGVSSPVQATGALTHASDLILSAFTSQEAGSPLPAGSGYTLGPSAAVATIGQMEYWLNAPIGTYNGNFGGSLPYWVMAWTSMKAAAASTPILIVSPLALSYVTQQYVNPAAQNFAISNGNGGTLNWVIASDSPWLSPSVSSGTGNASVAANVNVSGLAPGNYTGHLTVTAAGATGSPQVVTVTLQILGSTGGGGGGGGQTPCILSYANGVFSPDLSLYIQPATALYTQPVPTTAIVATESTAQGRNGIILDFNDSDGMYARDMGVIFAWPINSGTILDLWQPTIIPEQDDLYDRMSYHFLINALGLTGWGHVRELNIAHNAVADITLLLTFDQWPDITLTIPNSGGKTQKVKVILPPNKFKMVEGWLSSSQPFMLWGESCEMKLGQWGRADGYRVLKPFSG